MYSTYSTHTHTHVHTHTHTSTHIDMCRVRAPCEFVCVCVCVCACVRACVLPAAKSVRGRVRMYPPPHMTHMYPLAGSHEFGAPVFSIYVFSM